MNKKQKQVQELVDRSKTYTLEEALELLPKISTSKFVGSVELAINLKLSEKQQKEQIRGSVVFPNSFGNETKILVLADPKEQEAAQKAGADFVGLDDMVKKIEGGWMDFDLVIATPTVMPKIAKLGKYLGRKGLMPNPKNQTVTADIKKAVETYKKGKKNFKKNEQDGIKIVIGKIDMTKEALTENFEAFKIVFRNETGRLSGEIIKNVFLAPTMGPSIKLSSSVLQ